MIISNIDFEFESDKIPLFLLDTPTTQKKSQDGIPYDSKFSFGDMLIAHPTSLFLKKKTRIPCSVHATLELSIFALISLLVGPYGKRTVPITGNSNTVARVNTAYLQQIDPCFRSRRALARISRAWQLIHFRSEQEDFMSMKAT